LLSLPRIVFLDEQVAGSAAMAASLLRNRLDGEALVHAEGTAPEAEQVLAELGLGISDPEEQDAPSYDLAISIATSADPPPRPDLPGYPAQLRWRVVDQGLTSASPLRRRQAYRSLRDELRLKVESLLGDGYLQALLEARRRADRVYDGLDEAVIAHDEQRRIYVFNRAAERLTALCRADVLGRDCHQVFPPTGFCGQQCQYPDGNVQGPPGTVLRHEKDLLRSDPSGDPRNLRMVMSTLCEGQESHALAVVQPQTKLRGHAVPGVTSFRGISGASEPMQDVYAAIRQVAPTGYPVLVSGETGTGKELVSRAVHEESPRSKGPFVPINCGALPEHILESELFGHVRGAFTGAVREKRGRFELARGGTLFLDEVGELTPAFQVKLLRVLQEKTFERVGGERPIKADVRIVSATNRDLRSMVRTGDFRQDLFYRLCVVPIQLPPLRRRDGDIPLLVEHVAKEIEAELGRKLSLSPAAMQVLRRYPWPGNVRELVNALQYAAVRSLGAPVAPEHLPPEVSESKPAGPTAPPAPTRAPQATTQTSPKRRRKLDVESVRRALEQTGGNKLRAAELLGVGRATLYRFLNRHPL